MLAVQLFAAVNAWISDRLFKAWLPNTDARSVPGSSSSCKLSRLLKAAVDNRDLSKTRRIFSLKSFVHNERLLSVSQTS